MNSIRIKIIIIEMLLVLSVEPENFPAIHNIEIGNYIHERF